MGTFIKGLSTISPQSTFNDSVFDEGLHALSGNRAKCLEPDYSKYIDVKQIRRMSRIIKMSVAAAQIAMKDAGLTKPEAVIVGTAFGCLDDTYSFLSKLIQYKEDMLSPTAFIHSTHNTIAAQVALLFQCMGYNSTYVHKAISFESALMDAMLLINEQTASSILVGGADEIIDAGFTIMNRLGHFKTESDLNGKNLYDTGTRGSIAGEGATFFALTDKQEPNCYAEILEVKTISFGSMEKVVAVAKEMLLRNSISKPDLLLSGFNGDVNEDKLSEEFSTKMEMTQCTMKYKHYCGEYGTASAFALWLAATILKERFTRNVLTLPVSPSQPIKNILLHNHQGNLHHSLTLLKAC